MILTMCILDSGLNASVGVSSSERFFPLQIHVGWLWLLKTMDIDCKNVVSGAVHILTLYS